MEKSIKISFLLSARLKDLKNLTSTWCGYSNFYPIIDFFRSQAFFCGETLSNTISFKFCWFSWKSANIFCNIYFIYKIKKTKLKKKKKIACQSFRIWVINWIKRRKGKLRCLQNFILLMIHRFLKKKHNSLRSSDAACHITE